MNAPAFDDIHDSDLVIELGDAAELTLGSDDQSIENKQSPYD